MERLETGIFLIFCETWWKMKTIIFHFNEFFPFCSKFIKLFWNKWKMKLKPFLIFLHFKIIFLWFLIFLKLHKLNTLIFIQKTFLISIYNEQTSHDHSFTTNYQKLINLTETSQPITTITHNVIIFMMDNS